MRIRQTGGQEEESINLMPLIDMVFLLLIFFLVATTIAQEEREAAVQLPRASMAKPLTAPPKQVIINVLRDGTLKLGGRSYSWQELAEALAHVAKNEPHRQILIRADEMSRFRYYAEVVAICKRVGISETKIGYLQTEGKPAGQAS